MTFAAMWINVEIIIVSEVRERQTYDITYLWNLKYDTNEFIYKMETNSQTLLPCEFRPGCRGEFTQKKSPFQEEGKRGQVGKPPTV